MSRAARAVAFADHSAEHDHIIVLRGARWADLERVLAMRGDRSVPRVTYLEGELELMSPSKFHEGYKSVIGRLVEAWCVERDIDITPYGSWTLTDAAAERGAEPDECYVLGDAEDAERPDLAIEVVWTRGGVDKLDVYRGLRVREVWIWEDGAIRVHVLRRGRYEHRERSDVLRGIDLTQLARFAAVRPMTRAVRQYRAALLRGR